MKLVAMKLKCVAALFAAGILAAGPVMADKPSWAGSDKGGKNDRGDMRDDRKAEKKQEKAEKKQDRHRADGDRRHFQDEQHAMVREYYAEHYRGKRRCPPGLAKKNNGCVPPGQERKWQVGRQLPREVVYYEVPAPLVVKIGPPPEGHRYVRVAGDILLLAIGTGMVVDAIQDLGRM